MPQFWIAIFFVFLAVAQLYESIKAIELPLPVYLVLGTMLAIASNSQQKFGFNPVQPAPTSVEPNLPESIAQTLAPAEPPHIN
jgi:hypothetical protein